MTTVWFGVKGYPEIKRVGASMTADTRPGKFVRVAMCAFIEIGDWKGLIDLPPEHPDVMNKDVVIQKAKECVDWHRAKRHVSQNGGE